MPRIEIGVVMAQQSEPESDRGERPVSDVFSQFGDDLTESLRREFEQFRVEAGDRARAGARGAGILAAAAVSGTVAAGAALTLPVLAVKRIFGAGGTAVIVAVGAGGLTAYLAKRGLDELGVPTDAAAERVKVAAQQAVSSP
jgi:hypothetical protein